MAMLSEEDAEDVREELDAVDEEVTIHLFVPDSCQFCDDTVELNEEIAELSEKVVLEQHAFDDEAADEFAVDQYGEEGPVAVITKDGSDGVRYYGIPSGHEFGSYIADLVAVSTDETDIPDDVAEDVRAIDEEVNIKVFVTPTCPYCPQAVRTAHDFAIENENVSADMIEAQEFTSVSQEFGVRGVPQININGNAAQFTGAQPPHQFLEQLQSALGVEA
ncbi:MAG: thioredoxin family protein [Halobacteriales archaeon]